MTSERRRVKRIVAIAMLPIAFAFFLGVEAISGPSTGLAKEERERDTGLN